MASFWERVELGDLGLESESISLQDSDVSKSLKLYEPLFFNYQMGTKNNTLTSWSFYEDTVTNMRALYTVKHYYIRILL